MDNTFRPNEEYRKEIDELRSRLREVREAPGAVRDGKTGAPVTVQAEGKQAGTRYDPDHPYRVIFDHINEGAATLTEEGILLSGNARFARMLGLPGEELIGASFYDIAVPSEYHAVIDNLIARCVVYDAGAAVTCRIHLRSSQGTAFPVSLSLSRTAYNGSHVFCLLVTDLAEEKRSGEFKALLEISPDIIMRLDRELRFLYANPSIARLTGKLPDFYLGRSVREVVTAFDVTLIEEGAGRALETGETVTGEIKSTLPGEERYFSVSCIPERGPDGAVETLMVILHDVTSSGRTEKALRETIRRFALLAGTAEELLQSSEPKKTVESLCRKVMEQLDCHVFFNFLVDEKAGKLRLNACAGIPDEEAKRIEWFDYGAGVCGCAARDGCRIVAEHIPSTPDPRTELVRSYGIKAYACHPLLAEGGAVIGTLSFGSRTRETFDEEDLTLMKAVADQVATAVARMKNEQALRESEERFRAVVDNSLDAIIVADPDGEGKILSANSAACALFGYAEGEMDGLTRADVLDTGAPSFSAAGEQRAHPGSPQAELLCKRKDGTTFTGEVSAGVFTDAGGRKLTVAVIRDITGRRRTEERIEWLSTFPERNPHPIIEIDQAGKVTYANEAARTAFPGLGEHGSEHPVIAGIPSVMHERMRAGETAFAREIEVGGRWFHQALYHADTFGRFRAYMIEITERRKAEEALGESEERFRTVLNSSLDAAYRRDLRADRYDYISPVIEQVSGFTAEEFGGFGSAEVLSRVHPDDLASLEAVMTAGSSALIEYRFRGKDGQYRWFSDNFRVVRDGHGMPVCRVGIIRDITDRKRTEEALAASEKKYRELLRLAPAVIYEVDCANNRFTSVNDAMCEMLGYTREELLSLSPGEVLDDKSRNVFRARVTASARGEKPDECVEYTCRTKDGREIHVLLNATFTFDGSGKPCHATVIGQDITERKRMEEQLRQKEEEVRTLIDHSPDIIFRLDAARRYIFVNSAVEQHLGIPAASFIGNSFEATGYDDRTLSLFRGQYENVLATGEEQTLEFTLPANGDTKYFFSRLMPERGSDGAIVSLLGIMSDISEVKRKEQQLIALNDLYRKAKEEYQRLIDTANSIIMRWSPDGTLKFVNDYGLKFFGYTKKELMGKNAQVLIPVTDSSGSGLGGLILKITREPDKYSYSENENVKKSGERAWVMWTNKAITDEQGNLKEILAIGTDITALKKTQEELRDHKEALETLVEKRTQELLKTHAELERTRRMADIGRLASTIAHELRNPLSGIKTAAYNIQRKSDPGLLGKHIETINKKVQESDLIINNLLGFTRIKTLLHEPFRLQEVVRDCIAAVSAKYAKWNVTVTEDLRCGPDDVIEADFTQVRMLISNLLDNAFQALPDKSGYVSVSVSRDGMHYRIAISDNGSGIVEEELEKIFEPFYTTKSKGTGLGLTVCREIVDLHGGKISISSTLGKGTTFVVTLPAAQPFSRGDGQPVDRPGAVN